MSAREARLLVCAATGGERDTFRLEGEDALLADGEGFALRGDIAYAVTGVGVPCTLVRLSEALRRVQPALILNIGIAGAYPNSGLSIGDVVMGTAETFGDVGFELPEEPGFRPIREATFGDFYAEDLPLSAAPAFLLATDAFPVHSARGCTVNVCTGTEQTGLLRERLFQAGFESMEGAAFALMGRELEIAVCELRAVSNIASRRDMRPENIASALAHLRDYLAACRSAGRF